jgi:proton glutamate symport protein
VFGDTIAFSILYLTFYFMNLSVRIFIGLVLGAVFGSILNLKFPELVVPCDRYLLVPLGQLFLRSLQFVVVPLVFCSLIVSLNGIKNIEKIGKYITRLLAIYAVASIISVGLGIGCALLLHPGNGHFDLTSIKPIEIAANSSTDLIDWLIALMPTNPLAALSSDNLLQTIAAAGLFSIGIQLVGDASQPFVRLVESIYAIVEQILTVIISFAPIGIFALIAEAIAVQGLGLIQNLFIYLLGFFLAATIGIIIYIISLAIANERPLIFLQSLQEALTLAFGTASSNAALPIVLENMQKKYGLSAEIATFALPLGTILKRDGSAILQSFNALFVAQLYHVEIDRSLLISIGVTCFLISFSTPGVPGSGLINMSTVLTATGLPIEAIALVAGIDRLTDGYKTVLNVIGNTAGAIFLSRWVGVPIEPPSNTDLAEYQQTQPQK